MITYLDRVITFHGGTLNPESTPREGEQWVGPLCGMSYRLAAPDHPQPPSRNVDEIWMVREGQIVQMSADAHIDPYPPKSGPLVDFLQALRRQIPSGGRFRVNERGRAFTSKGGIFIGLIPSAQEAPDQWFRPLTARS